MHVKPAVDQNHIVFKNVTHVLCFPSGSALDINFSDISVASLDKELEDQDNSVGLASKEPPFVKADHEQTHHCNMFL